MLSFVFLCFVQGVHKIMVSKNCPGHENLGIPLSKDNLEILGVIPDSWAHKYTNFHKYVGFHLVKVNSTVVKCWDDLVAAKMQAGQGNISFTVQVYFLILN